ncbi:Protein kinase-like (PK-like) [Apiospora saccharicola]|uniref:Protein kinase-like (PK-like) n=1 Tax=Apiospora saccharicola TaxID=335842 RepID=A0ABR1W3P3_9PEZI
MSSAIISNHKNRKQEMDEPYTACLCNNKACQCAIEALRDKGMQALLLASQEDVSDKRIRFVPRASIIKEIRPDYISKVLQRVDIAEHNIADDLEQATNCISPRGGCSCEDHLCTGRRVMFASLLFAGLHHILAHFRHADNPGSCDGSLWKLSQAGMQFDDEEPIFRDIQQLNGPEKDLFIYWECWLRGLCIQKGGDNNEVAKLAVKDGLEDAILLPWESIEHDTRLSRRQPTQASNRTQVIGLQSAKVEKVCIHRSHHNLDDSTNYFALKTFLDDFDPRSNFEKELENNNAVPHSDRILPLLAAFEHRGKFYLLFPWTELRDLRNIWKRFSPVYDQSTGRHMHHTTWYSSQWLLEECLGITSAVADIHGRKGSASRQQFLLHADIKPDNILGFHNGDSISLKLADFGHSHILTPNSPDVLVSAMVNPRTYRAPEYDIQEKATIKYDVWSLGCLFLDFVTWALLGCDEVQRFQDRRLSEENDPKADYGSMSEDTFFKRSNDPQGTPEWQLHEKTHL